MAKYNGNAVVKGCRACYEAETQDYDLEYSIFVDEAGLDWSYLPAGGIGSDSQSSGKLVLSVTGKQSTTVTKSGTSSHEIEITDKSYSWNKKSTAQQVTITASYTWTKCLDSNDNRFTGTSTATHTFTIPSLDPAQYSYSVTLDSNGGSAVTSPLTKWYGENLPLPQPTRTGYVFAGWAASSAPTTVVYQPGAPCTANAAASLVAVWTPVITSATITQLYAARDDGSGTWDSQTGKHTSASDDGGYVYIRAWWRVEGADAATVSLGASMDSTPAWTGTAQQTSKPGTGELYIEGVAEWLTGEVADVAEQYDVTVTLSTGTGNPSDTRGTTVSTAFFTIDVLAGGHGIAFGKPATQQIFDVGMDANFDGALKINNPPILELVYPVGAIYMSTVSTSPAVLFGGTWERMTQRFLLGADDGGTSGSGQQSTAKVTAGSTGGQAGVTLDVTQIPSHTHDITYAQYNRGTGSSTTSALQYTGSTKTTEATGGGLSHNNMPPFIAVYMWKRTA